MARSEAVTKNIASRSVPACFPSQMTASLQLRSFGASAKATRRIATARGQRLMVREVKAALRHFCCLGGVTDEAAEQNRPHRC